ncbi:DUF4145 domain-containing protein [Hymenobacter yonginensis]|uniref:DUF4145 domain-containing protein n=1 Tax=Hymenobacter yonginensis TaxID=748197 RepID=A0ABY7PTV1_9BACT|nr:DUF4145 domain-containing protein [Hymenobacter yonginensis]WBO86279.1 DUF4145 domain-containing protein [Hymenobacter yonginensis]
MATTANITSETHNCGHCGNTSYMIKKGVIDDTVSEGDHKHGYYESGDFYRVLKCPNCLKINILTYFWHDSMDAEEDVNETLVYPQHQAFPVGLPAKILEYLTSAEKVKSIDVHAYALLLGRILEFVCYDRGAKSDKLYLMLEELAVKGDIPEKLVKVASGVRNFRNIGAHVGSGDLSTAELPIVRALLDAILTYIYSAEHLAAQAELKLSKIKKRRKV